MEQRKRTILDVVDAVTTLFRYLLTKWHIILLSGIVGGLAGITYAWLKKPKYLAEMSFVTETESKGSLGAYASIAAQFGLDIGGSSNNLFEGDNLIELLKSKHLIIKTLLSKPDRSGNKLLIHDYLKMEGWEDDETKTIDFSTFGISANRKRDSIILQVAKEIRSKFLTIGKRDKKLSIIDLRMTSKDELFSKHFCELLAVNAIHYYTDYKVKKSRQNVAILEKQTDSVRSMLYGNIGQMASMNDLNVNPARQILRAGSQRKQVDVQANSALYVELVKNLELSRLSLRKETPLIQIVDTPVLPLELKGFGRLLGGIVGAVIAAALTVLVLAGKRWLLKPSR